MVEAGRVLLVAKGLDGLSSQGVTTETDVALGTFYHHFAGKETLIEETVSEDDRRNSAAAAALADPPQAPSPPLARRRAAFRHPTGSGRYSDIGRSRPAHSSHGKHHAERRRG